MIGQQACDAGFLEKLLNGPIRSFRDGLHESIPLARPGVYTIWHDGLKDDKRIAAPAEILRLQRLNLYCIVPALDV